MSTVAPLAVPAGSTATLASFLADLSYSHLPQSVVGRTEDLFLDWIASSLAGKDAAPVRILGHFAEIMGPDSGPSQILVSRRGTSPWFAALVNGASSHVVEQDDVHNASVFHPGTVVFPEVLAAAQHRGASGRDLITAAVAGYEARIRIGKFLGRSHYRVFHTTGTAGTLAAAAGAAHILDANGQAMLHALGSAGTQAAGLWEFLRDAADSKFTDRALADPEIRAFKDRIEMVSDPEIDAAYPARWIGLVEVETADGRHFSSRVQVPRGDPENTLSRPEIEDKAQRLAAFRGGTTPEEMSRLIERIWTLPEQPNLRDLLPVTAR